jgi:anti-sigma factor RsiW
MSRFDPTWLTAYLDGELVPERRRRVEEALAADPRLAAQLEQLRQVRDVLVDLPPPCAGPDVAELVVSRLEEARRIREAHAASLRHSIRSWAIISPLSAVAAVLLIAWLRLSFDFHGARTEHAAAAPGAIARMIPDAPASPAAEPTTTPPAPAVAAHATGPAIDLAREHQALLDQGRLRALLGRGDVRRLVVAADDPEAAARVAAVLELTPRAETEQARLDLGPELALDPDHPRGAVVFAVALDEVELANLRKNLAGTLPKARIELEPAAPALVALLAESPRVRFSAVEPRGTLAHRPATRIGDTALRAPAMPAEPWIMRVMDFPFGPPWAVPTPFGPYIVPLAPAPRAGMDPRPRPSGPATGRERRRPTESQGRSPAPLTWQHELFRRFGFAAHATDAELYLVWVTDAAAR